MWGVLSAGGRGTTLIIMALGLLSYGVSPGIATTYVLHPDGSGALPTIQAALDASNAGDSILLAAGTYRGDGNRDLQFPLHDLLLIGLAGSAQTVLDVEGGADGDFDLHGGLRIDGGQSRGCLVQGIKIVDARLFGGMSVITVYDASPTLRDLVVEGLDGGEEYYGSPFSLALQHSDALLESLTVIGGGYCGGIAIYAGTPALNGIAVRSCYHDGNGGGISIRNSGASLTDIEVSHCGSWWGGGGGIYITGSPAPSLQHVSISHCSVSAHLYGDPVVGGGGIYILDANPTLSDLEVIDCSSVYEGGGIYLDGADCHIERALLRDNRSDAYESGNPHPGAGIYLKDASPQLERLTVLRSNRTAIFAAGASYPELSYSIVAEGLGGSALGKSTASAYFILRCDFWSNPGGASDGSLPDPVGLNENFSAPPLFCAEHAPLQPYSLTSGSPCAPISTGWYSPVGAFAVGCDYPAYLVLGTVHDLEGLPIVGVLLQGFAGTVLTDAVGNYSCLASSGWPLQVTPQLAGHVFSPLSRDYGILVEDHADQDYVGQPTHVFHVPGSVLTLAAAIASAASGDTILVAPGTYAGPGFRDLDPGAKNLIIIGEGGPAETVFDLEGAGRGITISHGQTEQFLLKGFTLRGGHPSGSEWGGAILVENASPRLEDLWLLENEAYYGGGLGLRYADAQITRLLLAGNTAGYRGGGLYLASSDPIIQACTFAGNSAPEDGGGGIAVIGQNSAVFEACAVARNTAGGGIYLDLYSVSPQFAHSLVFGNVGGDFTGGLEEAGMPGILRDDPLFCDSGALAYTLDSDSPCLPAHNPWGVMIGALTAYCDWDHRRISGQLSLDGAPLIDLLVETEFYPVYSDSAGEYTIMALPGDSTRAVPRYRGHHFDPPSRVWPPGTGDVPDQDFAAWRSTRHRVPDDFATLQEGLDAALDLDSVLVAPGTYAGPLNRDLDFAGFDALLLAMAGPESTIVDCEDAGLGIEFDAGESRAATVAGFTIRRASGIAGDGAIDCSNQSSPTLRNLVIEDSHVSGIACYRGHPLVQDVACRNNVAQRGGGLKLYQSAAIVENATLSHNHATVSGGGVSIPSSGDSDYHPVLRNCTIVGNTAGSEGGAIYMYWHSRPLIERCIVTQNGATATGGIAATADCSPVFACNDVVANTNGDWSETLAGQGSANGNFAADPLFCDAVEGDFHLQSGSPCLPTENDCRQLIGAWGEGCQVTAAEPAPIVATALFQNHPNPFNPSTLIRFALAEPAQVDLTIFDIGGRRVVQLLAEPRAPGSHAVLWDGRDEEGRPAASGVYFCSLTAGRFEARRKLVLLR